MLNIFVAKDQKERSGYYSSSNKWKEEWQVSPSWKLDKAYMLKKKKPIFDCNNGSTEYTPLHIEPYHNLQDSIHNNCSNHQHKWGKHTKWFHSFRILIFITCLLFINKSEYFWSKYELNGKINRITKSWKKW